MSVLGIELPIDSEKHTKILSSLYQRYELSRAKMTELYKDWQEAEEQVVAYVPETSEMQRRKIRQSNGTPDYVTMQVPYSYALLMTAHTYATSTLFGRDPIWQYLAVNGRTREKEQAVEALVAYNVRKGRHLPNYYIWAYDAFKYGIGILGEYWTEEKAAIPEILEQLDPTTGRTKRIKQTKVVPKYTGNRVFNVLPYNFFPDTRLPLHRYQEGEFCGVYVELSWNEVVRRADRGEYFNIEALRQVKHGEGTSWGNATSLLGQSQLPLAILPKPNPAMYVGTPAGKAESMVGCIEMVVELVPEEWELGTGKYPEKWIFTFTVDKKMIIGCRPFGYYHDKYPYSLLVLEPEAYNLVSRSMLKVLKPLQNTLDWLVNSHYYNVRQMLNNVLLADPSKFVMSDLLHADAGTIVRLKPAAYGTDVRTAISQLQIQDVTQQNMGDMRIITDLMQRVTGIVDGLMGMPQQGGRKTATEVRGANAFSINRMKTVVEWFSAVGLDVLSEKLLANCQQFYDAEMQLNIAGDLLGNQGPILVTPDMIAGEYDFIPVDGAMPVDRYAQANLLQQMLTQGASMPQLLAGYDLPGIFTHIMQLAGMKNINQFKVQPQILPPGVGPAPGMIPITAGQAQTAFNPEGMIEPGQIPGMGQTG